MYLKAARSFKASGKRQARVKSISTLVAIGALTVTSSFVAAGLSDPGGGTPHWSGNVSQFWNTAGNWTTGQVPAADAAVLIHSGPVDFIVVNGSDTANLRSVHISSGKTLSTNGRRLEVMNNTASTTVAGADSTLWVMPRIGGGYSARTQTLSVQSNGRLHMAGGHMRVHDQLTFSGSGRLTGNGHVEVVSPNISAFNALNAGTLEVTGGDLRIEVSNGGSMVLPNQINLMQPNRMLWLDGPLFLPVQNVDMTAGTTFRSDENWTLNGALIAMTGGGNAADVIGSGGMLVNGMVVVDNAGELAIDSTVQFNASAATTVNAGATLEINGIHTSQAGHQTTLEHNSTLRLTGWQLFTPWFGSITSFAGIIDADGGIGGEWRHDGELTLASWGGLPARIIGDSSFIAMDSVNVTGNAEVDNRFELNAGASMAISAGAQLLIDGELVLRPTSAVQGDGQIVINDGGSAHVAVAVVFETDVINNGTLINGLGEQPSFVDLDGSFTQGATGRMLVNIGTDSPTAIEADVLMTSLGVQLAGELNISHSFAHEPVLGESHMIIDALGGVTGTFDSVTGEPGWTVQYDSNSVTVTYTGIVDTCASDLDGDGSVSVADMLILLSAWGSCDGCASDLDGDGTVGVSDLLVLMSAWGSCS